MAKDMPLSMTQFTDPAGRDRKTYYHYAEAVCAELCFDDIRELMTYYECKLEDLLDRIVNDKLGTTRGDKWRKPR